MFDSGRDRRFWLFAWAATDLTLENQRKESKLLEK